MSDTLDNTSDNEDFFEDELDSSDEEVVEIQDLESTNINKPKIEDNMFYPILMNNLRLPSKFQAHALVMHRFASLWGGATPFVVDDKLDEMTHNVVPYTTTFMHIVDLVLKEIEEGVSPIVYYDPLFKEYRSINFLDKELLLKIIRESHDLSKD